MFYVYLLDEIVVLIQFLKDFRSMITVEITGVVILPHSPSHHLVTPSLEGAVDHALHEISRSAIGLHGIRYLREV